MRPAGPGTCPLPQSQQEESRRTPGLGEGLIWVQIPAGSCTNYGGRTSCRASLGLVTPIGEAGETTRRLAVSYKSTLSGTE